MTCINIDMTNVDLESHHYRELPPPHLAPTTPEKEVMQWDEAIYDFPADGWEVLRVLLDAVPWHLESEIVWVPVDGYRLRLESPSSAAFLRLAVDGLGVADADHPYLDDGELFVPTHLRSRCEQTLTSACHGEGAWSALIAISTASEAARRAWSGLYNGEW